MISIVQLGGVAGLRSGLLVAVSIRTAIIACTRIVVAAATAAAIATSVPEVIGPTTRTIGVAIAAARATIIVRSTLVAVGAVHARIATVSTTSVAVSIRIATVRGPCVWILLEGRAGAAIRVEDACKIETQIRNTK